MNNILTNIADTLYNQGIIRKEDIDKCRYGLDIFMSSVLEIVSILIISAIVGNFLSTILFFAAFIPLRIYSGGYHADTKIKCYIVSLCTYIIFSTIMYVLGKNAYAVVNGLTGIFSLLLVLLVAPIIHKNKSVNEVERKYYRQCSVCICSAETIIILLLTMIFPKCQFIFALALGQAAVTLSMIVAIIKGKIVDKC